MWQLSYPMDEKEAQMLSARGPGSLKDEALLRCGSWHNPIPQLLASTPRSLISGYPVYDRAILNATKLRIGSCSSNCKQGGGGNHSTMSRVTLIGDAAHPMSPFILQFVP